jgi:hypothetical protein
MRERKGLDYGEGTPPQEVWSRWRAELMREAVDALRGKLKPGFTLPEEAAPGG